MMRSSSIHQQNNVWWPARWVFTTSIMKIQQQPEHSIRVLLRGVTAFIKRTVFSSEDISAEKISRKPAIHTNSARTSVINGIPSMRNFLPQIWGSGGVQLPAEGYEKEWSLCRTGRKGGLSTCRRNSELRYGEE